MAKGIKLPNGNRLSHGQLLTTEETNPMTTQRPLNTAYSARIGAAKNTPDAPIKPGMKRQTSGAVAPYHHGVSVDDTPNVPLKDYERPIPVHGGMTEKQAAKHAASPSAKKVFSEAAKLGRK